MRVNRKRCVQGIFPMIQLFVGEYMEVGKIVTYYLKKSMEKSIIEKLREFYPACEKEFQPNHANSDANCYRKRPYASRKLVKDNPSICKDCVYNEREEGKELEDAAPNIQ